MAARSKLRVIALADTYAAIGCGNNIAEGSPFTTIELKSNFLSSARVGAPLRQTQALADNERRIRQLGRGVVALHANERALSEHLLRLHRRHGARRTAALNAAGFAPDSQPTRTAVEVGGGPSRRRAAPPPSSGRTG